MPKSQRCVKVFHYQSNISFVRVTSEQETIELAREIAPKLKGGDILALSGDLGAGKTTFTKGLAVALGITKNVTSPTFAIMNVYELPEIKNGIKTLVHIDAYRLETSDEILTIGVQDYLSQPDILTVIEWPEKIQPMLDNYKMIELKFSLENSARAISGPLI